MLRDRGGTEVVDNETGAGTEHVYPGGGLGGLIGEDIECVCRYCHRRSKLLNQRIPNTTRERDSYTSKNINSPSKRRGYPRQ